MPDVIVTEINTEQSIFLSREINRRVKSSRRGPNSIKENGAKRTASAGFLLFLFYYSRERKILVDSSFRSARIRDALARGRAAMGVPEAQKPKHYLLHADSQWNPHPHRYYTPLPYSIFQSPVKSMRQNRKSVFTVERHRTER